MRSSGHSGRPGTAFKERIQICLEVLAIRMFHSLLLVRASRRMSKGSRFKQTYKYSNPSLREETSSLLNKGARTSTKISIGICMRFLNFPPLPLRRVMASSPFSLSFAVEDSELEGVSSPGSAVFLEFCLRRLAAGFARREVTFEGHL